LPRSEAQYLCERSKWHPSYWQRFEEWRSPDFRPELAAQAMAESSDDGTAVSIGPKPAYDRGGAE
jgi:hypothetical protein